MTAIRWLSAIWHILAASPRPEASRAESRSLEFVPDATLLVYLENHPAPVAADSPDLALGSAPPKGVSLLVPLVSQGRLVGLLTLGAPFRSKAYSAEELVFAATLADEAAAAARIAQLPSGHLVGQLTVPRGT